MRWISEYFIVHSFNFIIIALTLLSILLITLLVNLSKKDKSFNVPPNNLDSKL